MKCWCENCEEVVECDDTLGDGEDEGDADAEVCCPNCEESDLVPMED